jgi:hypothetical protein
MARAVRHEKAMTCAWSAFWPAPHPVVYSAHSVSEQAKFASAVRVSKVVPKTRLERNVDQPTYPAFECVDALLTQAAYR